MISVASEHSLSFLRPVLFLVQPVATEKLPDAGVVGLLLRRFDRDELVEVFVDRGRLAETPVRRLGWTMPSKRYVSTPRNEI